MQSRRDHETIPGDRQIGTLGPTGRDVVDARGQRAPLLDLAVDLRDGDYPKVERVLVGRPNAPRQLPAPEFRIPDAGRDLRIDDLATVASTSAEDGRHELLLIHDLLDTLIIDLGRRGPARVNDLLLEPYNRGLRLKAVDTSARAIARRLTRGRWPAPSEADLTDWKYVAFLRGDPDRGTDDVTCGRISRLPPGEIARLSTALPYLHAAELIGLLPDHAAAEVFAVLAPERQIQIFEELREEQASNLLALLAPDAATDLLARLEPGLARGHLDRLPEPRRRLVLELLPAPRAPLAAHDERLLAAHRAGDGDRRGDGQHRAFGGGALTADCSEAPRHQPPGVPRFAA